MTYALTITQADLDAALAARVQPDFYRNEHCLLAQAVSRQEGKPCRFGYGFTRGLVSYRVKDTPARELISLFDSGTPEADATLRAILPMTVNLPAES